MKKTLIFLVMMFVLQIAYGKISYMFDRVLQNSAYQEQIYSPKDVVYLLPGQRYVASYSIHLPHIISGKMTIELTEKPDYLSLPLFYNDTTKGFNFNWHSNNSGQEYYCNTEVKDNCFESNWFHQNVRVSYWLGELSFINNLKPGDSLSYEFQVVCQRSNSDNPITERHYRTIKSIDRLRGDVDGNGKVDMSDVEILLSQVGLSDDRTYSKEGVNLYAGCVLNSEPDLASITLIQIWINDNNDPRVEGLGIGEWMSETQEYPLDSEATAIEDKSITLNSNELGLKSISAYPNPFYNQIVIRSNEVMTAELINIQGQVLRQIQLEIGENHISLSEVKSGLCILRTKNESIKLIKK